MKLYVGQYWIPFPSSEYGGQWVVTANSDEEVIDLLKEDGSFYEEYNHLIPHAVAKANVFVLNPEIDYEVGIVDTFFT